MDEHANGLAMYCHQIKIGDLFVLNTYKCKLCMYQNIQEKLIETITTSTFYLKFKEDNENDMASPGFRSLFLFQLTAEPNRPNS